MIDHSQHCRANCGIGSDDFRICTAPSKGEDACLETRHFGLNVCRLEFTDGERGIVIKARESTQSSNLGFSRPVLDLNSFPTAFVTLKRHEQLLSMVAKARVFKYLFEAYEGSDWMANLSLTSPQRTRPRSQRSRTMFGPSTSRLTGKTQFPWDHVEDEDSISEVSSVSALRSDPREIDAALLIISQLKRRVQALETEGKSRDISLGAVIQELRAEASSARLEAKAASEANFDVAWALGAGTFGTLDEFDKTAIIDIIKSDLNMDDYVTRS